MSNGKLHSDFTKHAACIFFFFTLHFNRISFLPFHLSFIHEGSHLNTRLFKTACQILILFGFIRSVSGQNGSNADVPYNHEFQVSAPSQYDQFESCTGYLDQGRFVVCWMVTDQVSNEFGIYGQIFLKNATRWGPEFQVNTNLKFQVAGLQVSRLPDNGFVVCWESWAQDGWYSGIYGQVFDDSGDRQGTEIQINDYTKYDQIHPSVSYLPEGGFIVCWSGRVQDGMYSGIFGKYYTQEIDHLLIPFSLLEPTDNTRWIRQCRRLPFGEMERAG